MLQNIKQVLKESVIYGVSGVLSRFAVLITVPIYSRVLGVEAFGLIDLYITIAAVLFVLLEMQIGSGFMRDYYDYKEEKKEHLLLGSVIGFYISGYIVFGLLYLSISTFLNHELTEHLGYILPLMLALLPRQIIHITGILLRLQHKPLPFLWINLMHFFSVALFGVITVFYLGGGVKAVLYATFVAQLISAIFAFYYLSESVVVKINYAFIKPMLKYGAGIVPAVIGGWLIDSSGRLLIANQLSGQELGQYAILVKIGMVMLLAVHAFRMTWEPFLMKKLSEDNGIEVLPRVLPYYLSSSFILAVCLFLISPFLMPVLGLDFSIQMWTVLPAILLTYVWQGAISIVASGILHKRKTYLNSISTLTGGLVSIAFTYVFLDRLGIQAAALGFLLGMLVNFFSSYYFSQSLQSLPFQFKVILIFLFLTAGSVLISVMN